MNTVRNLYKIKVLSIRGLFHLIGGVLREGKTMNLLLYFCHKMHPQKTALVQNGTSINYAQLYEKSINLASNFANNYHFKHGDKVALMAGNSIESAISLFALSRTGVHIYMINPELSEGQFSNLCAQHKFDFIVHEKAQLDKVSPNFTPDKSIPLTGNESIQQFINRPARQLIGKRKAGNIVVLTGGTTGEFKTAGRKQSLSNFLNPLVALVEHLQLNSFQSVYIPTPIYHGYGLAALTVSVLLGKEVYFTKGFKAEEACKLIAQHQIEVVTLVPIMLNRMLNEKPTALISLKRVLSGGAALNPELISKTAKELGPILYNLYGTAEVGFCILANPSSLNSHPESIGTPIKGVKARIKSGFDVGILEIKCNWSMKAKGNNWIETGDLASIDANKRISLKGRSDSMIVSGGENVYPKDLEDILCFHEQVDLVAVIGVNDDDFGQRLKAFVSLKTNQGTSEKQLKDWLKKRVAPHQTPVKIEILEHLPLTSIGKIDRKALR